MIELEYKPFIMIELEEQEQFFCYTDVSNLSEMITESTLLFVSVALVGSAARKYYALRGTHNRYVQRVYFWMLLWWITYVAKDLYSILLFFIKGFSISEDAPDSQKYAIPTELSKGYFVLDWSNVFIMQQLIVFVLYHWMKKLSEIMDAYLSSSSDRNSEKGSDFNEDAIQYDGIEATIHPLLNIYRKIRIIGFVPAVVFLTYKDDNTTDKIINIVLLSCLLVDCVVIIVVLGHGMHSLRTNKKLEIIDNDERSKMFNQYFIMTIACIFRIGADGYYAVKSYTGGFLEPSCIIPLDTSFQAVLFMIGVCILLHYLLIFIVIRIYTLDERPQKLSESLLNPSGFDQSMNSHSTV